MKRAFLVGLLFGLSCFSQTTTLSPDCFFFATFTATGRSPSAGYQNTSGCVAWAVTYANSGFSALSLRLDSAPGLTTAGATPGTWGAFVGTLQSGSNPNTSTTNAFTILVGFNPWVSLNLTSVTGTGTITAYAYGYRAPFTFATGTSVSGNVTITGPLGQAAMAASVPVVIASNQSNVPTNLKQVNGSTIALGQAAMAASFPVVIASNQSALPITFTPSGTQDVNLTKVGGAAVALGQAAMAASIPVVIPSNQSSVPVTPAANSSVNVTQMAGTAVYPCASLATANLSGSGNTQVIAASGTTVVRICHISMSTTASEDIKITQGTGSNCATPGSPADLTGLYKSVQSLAFDFGPFAPLTGSASQAICVNQSAGNATGVTVIYDQR